MRSAIEDEVLDRVYIPAATVDTYSPMPWQLDSQTDAKRCRATAACRPWQPLPPATYDAESLHISSRRPHVPII